MVAFKVQFVHSNVKSDGIGVSELIVKCYLGGRHVIGVCEYPGNTSWKHPQWIAH